MPYIGEMHVVFYNSDHTTALVWSSPFHSYKNMHFEFKTKNLGQFYFEERKSTKNIQKFGKISTLMFLYKSKL